MMNLYIVSVEVVNFSNIFAMCKGKTKHEVKTHPWVVAMDGAMHVWAWYLSVGSIHPPPSAAEEAPAAPVCWLEST